MDLYQLNGLTPYELYKWIMESPDGFSAEDGSIQYLGRQIQLHDGITVLSEQRFITAESKQLFERLVCLEPKLKKQLPGSKAEAIQIAASNLWDQFHLGAVEKSPTKEVQLAVFFEVLRYVGPLNMAEKLSVTYSLTWAEKLRFMLAAEEKHGQPFSSLCWSLVEIPLSIRFEEAKSLFQRLPDIPSLADETNEINEQLTALNLDVSINGALLEIRQILESENNELSRQLLSEYDSIEKKFQSSIDEKGNLSEIDTIDFEICTRRLLYLYAACSGFSREADITEVTSYIGSVLHTAVSDSIWHIAKELAYLSKQPGSIDYCRYIDALANILESPVNVALQFESLNQLSDLNGFILLESKKKLALYLAPLRANIVNMTPEYSRVLLDAVTGLERNFAAIPRNEDKPDIKAKVHRLLLIIAACKSSRQIMGSEILGRFVEAIMDHGNKKNVPFLISGLARLVRSTPKIQHILGAPNIKGGQQLRLAPLALLAFVPDIISQDDLTQLNNSLHDSVAKRRRMKDGKIFHQWLVTLEQALVSKIMNKDMGMQLLKKLTQSLTYEKLGLLHMLFKMGDSFHEFLNSIDLSCQKEGLPLLIAEQGANALAGKNKGVSQWLLQQRHYHLLPSYMASMKSNGYSEVTDLIHEFIRTSVSKTFIATRQSPQNNPHLQAVYRNYPKFEAGWGANFSGFSEATRNKLLSPGDILKLTEDPWDLFISGLEVKTCQSPEGGNLLYCNRGLMSYVMDGRNAMIVKKNHKGNILSRSVIRMVLEQNNRPALFLEKSYPDESGLKFIDAAREIAAEMKLPLYYQVDFPQGEEVKLLEGRAPFDYFDALNELKIKQNMSFKNVKRDVKQP